MCAKTGTREERKRTSGKHCAVKQLRQSCGPGYADGNNDTCVGFTSQSRTPRHKNGGRHEKSYGAAGPPPSALPLRNIVIRNDPHKEKCGFCHIRTFNAFHRETYLFSSWIGQSTPGLMGFRGSTIRGKMNRADRYVLPALSRTAGARRQVPERREKGRAGNTAL